MKKRIILTLKDLRPSELSRYKSGMYKVDILSFKSSSVTIYEMHSADIIIFSSGKEIIELKSRLG